jgi:8-oxo-dGTP diphosphatase
MIATADAVVIRNGKILLVERLNPAFQGQLALPGGKKNPDESIEDCVLRELREETKLIGKIRYLIGVYSAPGRDPRGDYLSVAFLVDAEGEAEAGDDAKTVVWRTPAEIFEAGLAFDHFDIVRDAMSLMIRKNLYGESA